MPVFIIDSRFNRGKALIPLLYILLFMYLQLLDIEGLTYFPNFFKFFLFLV